MIFRARLVRMDNSRLAKIVYKQRREQVKRANDWCSRVRKTLISLNLGHVWVSELVGQENDWKRVVKACLQEREEREWKQQLMEKRKLGLYRILKLTLQREEYLDNVAEADDRRLMTAMRSGTNTLRIETGRWVNEEAEERKCILCAQGSEEDERHALLECACYERERRCYVRKIAEQTNYDFDRMWDDSGWLLNMSMGVGCPEKEKRALMQVQTARFIGNIFRKRSWILKAESSG